MHHRSMRLIILSLVVLALLANAACAGNSAPARPTQRPDATETTKPERPTEPVAETATSAPTAEQETEEPTPTGEPAPSPAEPSATPGQAAAQGEILVMVDQDLMAGIGQDGTVRPFEVPDMDTQTFQVVASRDGRWLAGPTTEMQEEVTIYNVATGESRVFGEQEGNVSSFMFSPDSSQLLFMVKNMMTNGWRIKTIDLASGEINVIGQGTKDPAYQPLSWTPRGIVVTEVYVIAADSVPEALHLLDPEEGKLTPILPEGDPYIAAETTRDGGKIAIVKGAYGLGIENPTPALVIKDLATGEATEVEPATPGFIYDLHWSPGGTRLIYARTNPSAEVAGPPQPSYSIVSAAGGEPMRIDLTSAPGTVKDVAWSSDDSLLVLLAEGGVEKLYQLPATGTDASALRELATIESPGEDRGSAILSLSR